MNKLIVVLSICCFPFIMLAQEESTEVLESTADGKIARHEIGLNVTNIFERLISFNDLIIEDPNSYLLTYKFLLNHKRAIRIGLNGTFNSNEAPDSGLGDDRDILNSYDFDIRVGYFMNRRISKRWSVYLSIDAIYGYSHNEDFLFDFNGPNPKLIDASSTFGGGPAIGIQFFINSRISLSTELSIYYKNSESQITIDEGGSSLPESVATNKFSNATIASPASLYFNFRF